MKPKIMRLEVCVRLANKKIARYVKLCIAWACFDWKRISTKIKQLLSREKIYWCDA